MNRLIQICILWSLAISIASAQEADTSKDESNQRNPDEPQAEGTPSANSKAVVATTMAAETELPANSPIRVTLRMRKDESYEKIEQLIEALKDAGVKQLSFSWEGVRSEGEEERNTLILHLPQGFTLGELQKIESAANTKAVQCGLRLFIVTQNLAQPAGEFFGPADPQPPQPVEPKRITVFPTGDAQESEVAMKFIAYLEKEGFATGKVTELTLTPDSPLQVDFFMRHDESHEKVKEFLTSLGDTGVERIFLETDENVIGGDEENGLSFRAIPGYSPVEVERIENAAVSAAKSCGLALRLGGTYVKSWKPNGESATVPSLRPVEPKRIAVFADVDEEPSEMVTRFLTDLESDGIANVKAKASAPAFRYPIQLNFVPKDDEPLEKIKQFLVALRQSGVEQINCDLRGHRGGQNTVLFTVLPGYSHEEQQRIENAARTAAANCGLSIDLAGTMVLPSDANAQKITQLRTDYEAANKQAHDLAESLRQTPDATKKAELRAAVQRAFTLRQRLLRAELQEMQARLEKTQQSLDMRDRIVDQIVDRRVEDLLNPELKWDDEDLLKTKSTITSTLTAPTKPKTTSPTIAELDGDWHRMSASGAETPHFNITIHGSTWTKFVEGKPEAVEFLYDTTKKTIEFKSTPPLVYTYEVHGDSLILHNETQTQAFNRGHRRPPDATELEGDWRQMSSATDKDGKPLTGGYASISFRKNQYTYGTERGQHRCRVDVISNKKEIRYFQEGEYNFFVQDYYLLEGDQLTIYDENRKTVYRRVKVIH